MSDGDMTKTGEPWLAAQQAMLKNFFPWMAQGTVAGQPAAAGCIHGKKAFIIACC